jgi:hypothetical protein
MTVFSLKKVETFLQKLSSSYYLNTCIILNLSFVCKEKYERHFSVGQYSTHAVYTGM